jgi:hypothetical protein
MISKPITYCKFNKKCINFRRSICNENYRLDFKLCNAYKEFNHKPKCPICNSTRYKTFNGFSKCAKCNYEHKDIIV